MRLLWIIPVTLVSSAVAAQQPAADLPPIAQACIQQWQRAAGESMDLQAQLIDARKQIAELQKQLAAAKPAEAMPHEAPK